VETRLRGAEPAQNVENDICVTRKEVSLPDFAAAQAIFARLGKPNRNRR
jgi:hypothetical protein